VSLLARLSWGRCARAVAQALSPGGTTVVVGAPALARVLAQRGHDVTVVADDLEPLPFEDGAVAAVVAVTRREPRAEWQRVVRRGGVVVLVAPIAPAEMSRRALCAGLVDLTAARSGRLVITTGRVWRPRPAPAP